MQTTVEVTLSLPKNLVENATLFGKATERDVDQVLADALEMMWATVYPILDSEPSLAALSDEEVLGLSDLKMDPEENERLGALQAKGKQESLSSAERIELMALLHIYQKGQLRKSEALAESVSRGLQSPLEA